MNILKLTMQINEKKEKCPVLADPSNIPPALRYYSQRQQELNVSALQAIN